MRIAFLCPGCRHRVEADGHAGGTRLACPACGKGMIVPQAQMGAGVTLGGFLIEKRLGKGGMGDVFLARQLSLDRTVALKVLSGQLSRDKEMADRFLAEVKTLARLDHPNIVMAYEAGADEGMLFLAMAYVSGKSLEERLEAEGPMEEAEALGLIRKLTQALAYAWKGHRLLHRDIKPANVLLDTDGEPKLADFGLAKTLEMKQALTLDGSLMGTPNYMSPEQVLGTEELDFRSDLYSMGTMLYHMLTGTIPFGGNSVVETLRKQMSEALPDPRLANPKVSEGSVAVLERMLAKKREQRYESWEALLGDLDLLLAGKTPGLPQLAVGESMMTRSSDLRKPHAWAKPAPRGKAGLVVALAGLGILALGIGIAVWSVRKPATVTEGTPAETPALTPGIHPLPAADVRPAQAVKPTETQHAEKEGESAGKAALEAAAQAEQERLATEKAAQEAKAREQIVAAEAARLEREKQENALAVARARLADALGEVAGLLLKPDYAEARDRVEALRDQPELAPLKTEIESLAKVAGKSTKPDESVLMSFEREKGDTVTMETKSGTAVEVRIMGVSAGLVQARQMVQGALVERSFGPGDLSLRERVKRLGAEDTPETRIQRGLVLGHEGGAWDQAEREFASAGPLGEALAGALKTRRAGRESQAVRAALAQLLKTAGLSDNLENPDRVIESVAAKPIASADAVLVRTMAANVIDTYPGTDAAAMAQALTAALSGDAETTARIQLLKLLKSTGIEPDLERPEKMVESIETRAFGANVEKVQKAALDFSQKQGQTETARKYRAIIEALIYAHADVLTASAPAALLEGTAENLDKAIAALRAANPKFTGRVITNSISQGKISLELGADPNLKDIRSLTGLPLVGLALKGCAVEDLSPLAGLPLTSLEVHSSRLTDLRPLVGLENVANLMLYCSASDLRPLREIRSLKSLEIVSPALTRLDGLKGVRLEALNIGAPWTGTCPVEDLTPLADMPLQSLTFGANPPLIADLTPLKDCPIKNLSIFGSLVKSLDPLSKMPLIQLSIHNSPVSDLSPLAGLPLWKVELSNIGVTDLSALKSDKLTTLSLFQLPVRSLRPLSGCPLQSFVISNLPRLNDFEHIPEYFPDLKTFQIQNHLIKSSFIARFTKLTRLSTWNEMGSTVAVPLETLNLKDKKKAAPSRRQAGE